MNISQHIDRYFLHLIKHDNRLNPNEIFLTYTPSSQIDNFNV